MTLITEGGTRSGSLANSAATLDGFEFAVDGFELAVDSFDLAAVFKYSPLTEVSARTDNTDSLLSLLLRYVVSKAYRVELLQILGSAVVSLSLSFPCRVASSATDTVTGGTCSGLMAV